MTRHHPSSVASPGTASPTMTVPSFNGSVTTYCGYDVNTLIDHDYRLRKSGLTFETSHELLDRLSFISINGGHLTMTDDGPRLDDDNETLFLIGREARS